jgi:hypothetical protein
MILYAVTPDGGPDPTVPDEGSAVMEVRNMILERVGEVGLANDLQIRSFVRRANRKVWERAILKNPIPWATRSAPTAYPGGGSLSLDALTGADASTYGDLALSFGAAKLRKLLYVEVNYLGGWFPIFEANSGERWLIEPGLPLSYAAPRIPANYYIEGQALWFSRVPDSDLEVRAVFVPSLPDPADAEHMLLGRFPEHHDLVATEAARLCFARDERKGTPFDAEAQELLAAFTMALADGQGGKLRRVGARSPWIP